MRTTSGSDKTRIVGSDRDPLTLIPLERSSLAVICLQIYPFANFSSILTFAKSLYLSSKPFDEIYRSFAEFINLFSAFPSLEGRQYC